MTSKNKSQVQKYKVAAKHSKKGKQNEQATNFSDDLMVNSTSSGSNRPAKKQRIQKNKDNSNVIQTNDIEVRQKWLEQEQQAIELLKQKIALEKELLDLKQK
ncbi:hypothetical protein RhiirA4_427505 [Rhizophagus irregularis]|uniref:Uncharacterized protein n=1 Tax=Rhizophagus irregularis TaxID=588596 RepID=A0A2I1H980_9GLOM|nr:hypothetical protein RhiirA4_427505 [Rhizophagus irregularis]